MNTRDHHVADQAPDWSRPSQAFRHLDGRAPDWRDRRPGQEPSPKSRPSWRARVETRVVNAGRLIVHYFAPTPQQRLILGTFFVGMAWGVMCAIGMMAAWGIHP